MLQLEIALQLAPLFAESMQSYLEFDNAFSFDDALGRVLDTPHTEF